MDLETKIKNMTKIIGDLNKENESLKEQVVDLQVKLGLSERSYEDTLDNAKDIITKAEIAYKEYNEAIKVARDAEKKYNKATKEIYGIKKDYLKKVKELMKQIGI